MSWKGMDEFFHDNVFLDNLYYDNCLLLLRRFFDRNKGR